MARRAFSFVTMLVSYRSGSNNGMRLSNVAELSRKGSIKGEKLQEVKEQQLKDMKEVRTMLHKLEVIISLQVSSNSPALMKSGKERGCSKMIRPKLTRLEFPKFNGDDLNEWLYKCEQ